MEAERAQCKTEIARLVTDRKVLVENDQVKEEWRKYMEKLVPWGTDGRLPLSGDFRSLIVV